MAFLFFGGCSKPVFNRSTHKKQIHSSPGTPKNRFFQGRLLKPGEISQKGQAQLLAFFGMKLKGIDIVPMNSRNKIHAILSGSRRHAGVIRRHIIGVHKIKIGVVRDAVEQGRVMIELHSVSLHHKRGNKRLALLPLLWCRLTE